MSRDVRGLFRFAGLGPDVEAYRASLVSHHGYPVSLNRALHGLIIKGLLLSRLETVGPSPGEACPACGVVLKEVAS